MWTFPEKCCDVTIIARRPHLLLLHNKSVDIFLEGDNFELEDTKVGSRLRHELERTGVRPQGKLLVVHTGTFACLV